MHSEAVQNQASPETKKASVVAIGSGVRPSRRWPVVFLGITLMGLLLTLLSIAVSGVWPVAHLSLRLHQPSATSHPAFHSPYKNTQPGVEYLGDQACQQCHREIAESYYQHPMGRSLVPIAQASSSQDDEQGRLPRFKAQGLEYSIERQDGRVIHLETCRDMTGRPIVQNKAEVNYVIGSGRRGVSYLIERDGFLVQSPITWYTRARRWGLSPGYEDLNYHFDRAVQPGCLFCHANSVLPVSGVLNRYEPPTFRGHAIGCERCHGPGALHAADPFRAKGEDLTIVNPATLAPPLRDAVCEQCHLSGTQRVERPGHRYDDYRPGLPLQEFWTVLVPASQTSSSKFVGQVEQMRSSRCFQASQGALGCIYCHDPHRLPGAAERLRYFQRRCLQCHREHGCSLDKTVRLEQNKDDDCTACHMPRLKSSDIPHIAMTDHRVLRQPARDDTDRPNPHYSTHSVPIRGSRNETLVPFHRELMSESELDDRQREIGIAESRSGPEGARRALPRLEAALARNPRDPPAWQAKGVALGWLNRPQESLAAFEIALKQDPTREWAIREAAQSATLAGEARRAESYWQRAIVINPWRSDYHASLAGLFMEQNDWSAAIDACQATLRLNPFNVQVRRWLGESYLKAGEREAAQEQIDILERISASTGPDAGN